MIKSWKDRRNRWPGRAPLQTAPSLGERRNRLAQFAGCARRLREIRGAPQVRLKGARFQMGAQAIQMRAIVGFPTLRQTSEGCVTESTEVV